MLNFGASDGGGRIFSWPQILVLIVILLLGGAYVRLRIEMADQEMRDHLLLRTRLMAEAVNPDRLKGLSGTPEDLDHPVYRCLKEQLILLKGANPDLASIYLVNRKPNGKLFFLLDSEIDNGPSRALPGKAFEDSSPDFDDALGKWAEIVEGPDDDRGGHWISTLVPILDPLNGKPLAGLGVDIGVVRWNQALTEAALPGVAITSVLIVLTLTWMLLLNRRKRLGETASCRTACLNMLAVAVIGTVLSFFIAWRVMVQEKLTRSHIFEQLAADDTELVARIIKVMRSAEFEGLQSFLAHSRVIEKEEFQAYCDHLENNPLVRAWVWTPLVTGQDRAAFEAAVRREIDPGFRLWEFGADGQPEPAAARQAHFPVLFVAPEAPNRRTVGFDLTSDPARRAALEEAMRNSLPSGTEPLHLIDDPDNETGMLIFNPVFDRECHPAKLRGFAMIAIRLSALLQRNDIKSDTIRMSLSLVRSGLPPKELISEGKAPAPVGGIVLRRPIFAFGKVFMLSARPGPVFLKTYPLWKHAAALLAGLGFTAALATIVMLVGRRKNELERLVAERTFRLNEREERFLQLAEHSRTLAWDVDTEGRFTYVNNVFESLLGYRAGELVGHHYFYDVYPEFRREAVKKKRFELMTNRQSFHNLEDRLQTKDGRIIWVSSNGVPLFDREGKLIGYSGECTDITNRKAAEETAERQHEFQKMLTEVATTYINLPLDRIDPAINRSLGELGRFFGVDRFYIFSYDFENRCCTNTHEWCAPGIEPQIGHLQNTPLAGINSWVETTCRGGNVDIPDVEALPDGDELKKILMAQDIKSLLCAPLMDGDQCIGFTGFDSVRTYHRYTPEEANLLRVFADMLVNVQSRRRTEEELLRRGKAAEAANRAKSEFLTNMSHEIRTPMNAILGVAELLVGADLKPEEHSCVETIRIGGKQMMSLIDEILNYANLDAGKEHVSFADFPSSELLDRLRRELEPAARSKNLALTIQTPPGLPETLRGDLPHLYSVLFNLAGNAIKFTSEGGVTIAIEIANQTCDAVDLRFTVRDTGIGIAREQYGRLFGAFDVGDASLNRRYGGAGLGLSTARQLVRLMGGELDFKSEPGAGSEFYFTLSFLIPPPTGTTVETSFDTDVLLAEDNAVNRKVMLLMLRKFGLRAEVAENGLEVLRFLKTKSCRAVLMDVQMPEMDGLEATRQIRDPATPVRDHRVPVIAVTAHAVAGYEERCRDAGMDDYLAKPVTPQSLREVLGRWLKFTPGDNRA